MICHLVLIRLRNDVNSEQATSLLGQAQQILNPIPGVQNFRAGKALKPDYPHPLSLVMEFEDEAALQAYQVHPEHRRFVDEVLGPILDDKQVYDYLY